MKRAQSQESILCGFIPLTDCAPLVVARELGFAAEEGVELILKREASWSNIRDKLGFGLFDCAHMLTPMPLAMSLGLSAVRADIDVPMILSVNGNTVGMSSSLRERLSQSGSATHFTDARRAAGALQLVRQKERSSAPLRIGVPWTFSMHTLLIDYWLGRCGFDIERDVALSVVPPPFMAEVLAAGEIDLFCVGEPWGSIAVEKGVGAMFLSGSAIWNFAPEKALGVRRAELKERPQAYHALLRALYRAAAWCADPTHRGSLVEILARPAYVDAPAEVIERALSGNLIVNSSGEMHRVGRALEFHAASATFPWRSQAGWIAHQLRRRYELSAEERQRAQSVFRPDVYRAALSPLIPALPLSSSKLEGSLTDSIEIPAASGSLILGPDAFFDGSIFDPTADKLPKF
ncbi:MAG: ABC transporter substrate-binding protein [Neomegalonema sp.]|nr:ABC transporter substrate-binding protein [Neomegalonema sp.]